MLSHCSSNDPDYFKQGKIYCGPEKEDCVQNQMLTDPTCLVPCSGIYADVTDNSLAIALQRYVTEGMSNSFYRIQYHYTRFPVDNTWPQLCHRKIWCWSASSSTMVANIRKNDKRWSVIIHNWIQQIQNVLCQTPPVFSSSSESEYDYFPRPNYLYKCLFQLLWLSLLP